MGAMSPTHWLIVIVVFVLLFGAKKLPDMARSVGQSARVLKGEMKGLRNDGADDEVAAGSTTAGSTTDGEGRAPGGTLPAPSGTPATRTAPVGTSTPRE